LRTLSRTPGRSCSTIRTRSTVTPCLGRPNLVRKLSVPVSTCTASAASPPTSDRPGTIHSTRSSAAACWPPPSARPFATTTRPSRSIYSGPPPPRPPWTPKPSPWLGAATPLSARRGTSSTTRTRSGVGPSERRSARCAAFSPMTHGPAGAAPLVGPPRRLRCRARWTALPPGLWGTPRRHLPRAVRRCRSPGALAPLGGPSRRAVRPPGRPACQPAPGLPPVAGIRDCRDAGRSDDHAELVDRRPLRPRRARRMFHRGLPCRLAR
jgi:hypothetical protein